MSDVIQAEDAKTFRVNGIEFHVVLTEAGALKVTLTGRGNGRMLVLPGSNCSVSLHSEKTINRAVDSR